MALSHDPDPEINQRESRQPSFPSTTKPKVQRKIMLPIR